MWLLRGSLLVVILFSIQAWAKIPKEFFSKEDVPSLRQTNADREGRSWRLPNTTYPLKYHLHITTWIHQEVYNFTGNVTIELMVKENTSELVLHTKDLKIQKIFAQDLETKQNIENLKPRIVDDLLIIEAIGTEPLFFTQNQRLRLELHYTGIIDNSQNGFSVMTYEDDKNNKIYGAYTQMEPIHAREVLPCYDEPSLKANFTVRITHGGNYTAISNMPAISSVENRSDEMITTYFMETPLMSTYLLAFVISNYEVIVREGNGVTQRVFLPPNSENKGNLALSNGIEVLKVFSSYMDVPYTLPKLDHISINGHEYDSAAMENWGLITYSEFYLPSDEDFNTNTQNHEIVHQWFGNLVSPEWWNSLWLNEGFAKYYSNVYLTKKTSPDHKPLEVFLSSCLSDSIFKSSISVADYVETPWDIQGKFSFFNGYTKAPCIIQMFEHAFEEPVFRKGVSNYLKKRAFSTANENHLYEHLQAALLESPHTAWNYSVHELMTPWLHAKTLPIVTITRDTQNSNIIHIQQKPSRSNVKELWWIPLNFATKSQPNTEITKAVYYMPPVSAVSLNLSELNITLNDDDWILANIQSMGLYRVNYDKENFIRLAKAFNTNNSIIHKINRKVILQSIPRVWKEQLSAVPSLEILKYIPHEKEAIVWNEIIEVLESLQGLLCPSVTCDLFNDFVRGLIKPQYLKHYKTPEKDLDHSTAVIWRNLTNLACELDVPECIEQRKKLYEAQKGNIFKAKSFDFANSCSAAESFNVTEFDDALKILKKAPNKQQSIAYWHSLLCTRKEIQYEQLLEASANDLLKDVIRTGSTRKILLRDWADLLKENVLLEWKWNLAYSFLKKQITELQKIEGADYELCQNMASVAKEIKKPYHEKYIELMELCSKQLLMSGTIEKSSDIMPNASDIGVNYAFENSPIWQLELQKVHSWLKEQNSY